MGTVAEKLEYLTETKQLIADAVNAKGGDITPATPFREYADKIEELPAGIVDKKLFNVSIEQILGSVDENGNYVKPNSDPADVDLTGVKYCDVNLFYYANYWTSGVKRIYAPDLEVATGKMMSFAAPKIADEVEVYCPKLVEIGTEAFSYFTSGCDISVALVNFESLVGVGTNTKVYNSSNFRNMLYGCKKYNLVQRMFPKLKTVYGTTAFGAFVPSSAYATNRNIPKMMFPEMEDFYGQYGTTDITTTYNAIFGDMDAVVFLPKCTRVPTYMFQERAPSSSYQYQRELHFAIKNRAIIEACAGYNNNFGGTGVFFDLVSAITVNDVVYQRSEDDSITETFEKFYTAWKSDNGDIVYTYDGNYTVEPAVGTEVFSDGGQTVVGTVSAIE